MSAISRRTVVLLAALAAGCGRAPEITGSIRFADVTAAAGIRFTHTTGATGQKLLPETMGSGVGVLDFDGDGRPDLVFVNGRRWPGDPGPVATMALYRNCGDGTFEDRTAGSGLEVELQGMGVAVGDFDNDGRPDLFVTAVGGNRLFRNVGGRFEDVTDRAGVAGGKPWPAGDFFAADRPVLFPASATWLDYDGDGKLDLFVCEYLQWSPKSDRDIDAVLPGGRRAYVPPTQFPPGACHLYRNRGDGTFEDVSITAGVGAASGKPLGVAVFDPDGDGWPDLLVACDTTRNLFFCNRPDGAGGRKFEEHALSVNAAYASDGQPRGGMGIDAAELRPGALGVAVANFANEPTTLLTLTPNGPLTFRDTAVATGLAGPSRGPMKFGAVFLDYDADGRPDLLTANGHLEPDIAAAVPGQTHPQAAQLFRNLGERFESVGAKDVGSNLFQPVVGRGLAVVDYDGDGVPDVVLTANGGSARLLRCVDTGGRKRLRLELVGNGTTTNRDALGAEVAVTAGGVERRFYVTASRGYLSSSERAVTAGLDTAGAAERVRVRWPGGGWQEWADLPAGAYRLVQGVAAAERIR